MKGRSQSRKQVIFPSGKSDIMLMSCLSALDASEILKKSTNVAFALWLGFIVGINLRGKWKTKPVVLRNRARRDELDNQPRRRGGSPLLPYKKISSLKARH